MHYIWYGKATAIIASLIISPLNQTMKAASTILQHPDALIHIEELGDDRRRIVVEPSTHFFMPLNTWETTYSVELIKHVLQVKDPAYLCDEIRRDESPAYVQHHFNWDILSYVDKEAFAGSRILDFGSGSGASSMVLSRMLPADVEIVGVELVPEFVELATARAKFYEVDDRISFLLSPDPHRLPDGIGQFDYVLLSAVFEHLLPSERKTVLNLIWEHLAPKGILFLDQTPQRWFPIESHTTGLPLLNYLPDRLATLCARHFSKRIETDETWTGLLRKGIRGGTPNEIMSILNKDAQTAELLQPTRLGVKNHIELWYMLSKSARAPMLKRVMKSGIELVNKATGHMMIPTLSLAIQRTSLETG